MQCLPLASLLLALENPTVNYLSLDLEGAELEVPSIFLRFRESVWKQLLQLPGKLGLVWLETSGDQDDTVQAAGYRGVVCGIQPPWKVLPFLKSIRLLWSVNIKGKLNNIVQGFPRHTKQSSFLPRRSWLLLHRDPCWWDPSGWSQCTPTGMGL